MNFPQLKNLILDIFFPKICFGCQREGEYLCQDCKAILDFTRDFYCLCQRPKKIPKPGKCKNCQNKNLDGLYFPFNYQQSLIKNLIFHFKYEPHLVKELAKPLANLWKDYFLLLDEKINFSNFLVLPLPLEKSRLKWRGFNQSEELARYFCQNFNLEMRNDVLIKVKKTKFQVNLDEKERRENIKGAFLVENKSTIEGRKILLIDDIYTTGSTLEEAAKILKESGAKEVWGLVLAREEFGNKKNKRYLSSKN